MATSPHQSSSCGVSTSQGNPAQSKKSQSCNASVASPAVMGPWCSIHDIPVAVWCFSFRMKHDQALLYNSWKQYYSCIIGILLFIMLNINFCAILFQMIHDDSWYSQVLAHLAPSSLHTYAWYAPATVEHDHSCPFTDIDGPSFSPILGFLIAVFVLLRERRTILAWGDAPQYIV